MTKSTHAKHPDHPNHQEYLEKRKRNYQKNHDKWRATQLAWEAKNPDKVKLQRQKWNNSDDAREYYREYAKFWRREHPERRKEIANQSYRKHHKNISVRGKRDRELLRIEMIAHYGGACACCGEMEPIFLSLDHKNNDGSTDPIAKSGQKRGRLCGIKIYQKLKKLGWPVNNYQLLCYNCNIGKYQNGGVCPHQAKREAVA